MKMTLRPVTMLVALMVLFIQACNNEQASAEELAVEPIKEDVSISQSDLEGLNYKEFELSPEVQNIVVDWNGFQQIASSVSFLKTADFSFFKSEIDVIKGNMNELRTGIPETLNTKSILSRLTVVETTFLKLQNDLTLDNISKDTQLESIEEVLIAWSNLTFTMNKKLEFESNNVDRPE